jgi:hypothetical protein
MGVLIKLNDEDRNGSVKPKKQIWYYVTKDNKKVFVGEEKAEELFKQGVLLRISCKKNDL